MSGIEPYYTPSSSNNTLVCSGITLAIIEVITILGSAAYFRNYNRTVKKASYNMNGFTYYWFIFTMFTGFMWELAFVSQYKSVNDYSECLIQNNQTVWLNKYSLDYLLPWKFSKIFYGEYGAYADREYMTITNDWSRVIESTHAIFCATFALISFVMGYFNLDNRMSIAIGVSMGTQLMNSILYMAEYVVQMNDPNNVNYPTNEFPTGVLLVHRPFMWVNIFWTLFPLYILVVELIFKNGLINIYNNSKSRFEFIHLFTRNDNDGFNEYVSGVQTRAAKRRLEIEQEKQEKQEK